MGISLIHDLSGLQLAYWLGPALATTGVLLVTGLLLEAKKFMVSISVGSWFWLRSSCWAIRLAWPKTTSLHVGKPRYLVSAVTFAVLCCWQYLQESLASSIVSTCMLELLGYPKQSFLAVCTNAALSATKLTFSATVFGTCHSTTMQRRN